MSDLAGIHRAPSDLAYAHSLDLAQRLAESPHVPDLFAGPGGWDEGVRELGITPRGIDLDPDACDTGRAAGHYRHLGNVAAMNPLQAAEVWGPAEGLLASPPCPGFAHGGLKRGRRDGELVLEHLADVSDRRELEAMLDRLDVHMNDGRTLLALEPLRWALALGPRWLAWEQVPAVEGLWQACAAILRGVGYTAEVGVLHADAFGVPQVRRRAVLVARSREASEAHGPATLPAPTHVRWVRSSGAWTVPGQQRWLSQADALGWGMTHRPYPAIAPGTARGGQDPMMLGGSGAREAVRRELEAGRWRWNDERLERLGADRRPHPEWRPEWTLETRRALRLSVAEAGVLQGFRGDYPWQGRPTAQYRQVGDAVPPVVARRIVEAVRA